MSQQHLEMSGNAASPYQLIEENVRDNEYHTRKYKCKRYLLLVICLIIILLGIGSLLFVLTNEGIIFNSDANTDDNNDSENPDFVNWNSSLECQPYQTDLVCHPNPQFPMIGGAGCGTKCATDQYCASLNFENHWPQQFLDHMRYAREVTVDIIRERLCLDNDTIFQLDGGTPNPTVHLTLDYFCCLTYEQLEKVNEICENYVWPAMDIEFDHVICTQDGWHDGVYYHNDTYVEIVTIVSNISQIILLGAVTALEQLIIDAGIPIRVPRSKNIEFHSTIGFVNGTAVGDVPALVYEINKRVNDWNELNITIDEPNGHICTENRNAIGRDKREFSCLTGFS